MSAGDLLKKCLLWRAARAKRLAQEKIVEKLKEDENAIKQAVFEAFKNSPTKAVSDGTRTFKLVTKEEPTVKDWNRLYAHVRETGEFELIQKRLNTTAAKERNELGVAVPGVSWIDVDSLSDTKA